jgi:type IV pilus assembly protein PilW
MDAFVQDTYGVMCDTLVAYSSLAPAGSCSNTSSLTFTGVTPMVGDVVQVQAQYGITSSAGSDVITSWEDASGGTWTAPSATDIPRIKAVRVAVIARSKESAPNAVSQACTNAASVANTGPCTFEDAEAPVVNLSASSVPSGKTWQNYRYRVYKTIIPLRNVAWNY